MGIWTTEIYQEPLFWKFPIAATVIGIVSFLLFALPMTWVAWRDPAWAAPWRIQKERRIEVQRWFWPSLRCMAINNLIMLPGLILSWPLLRLSGIHDGPLPAWYTVVWQLLFFILLDDFLYYWMHRAMHTKWLFRHVHAFHHRPRTPCAIAGNYLHWGEYIATISLLLIGPMLVGAHVITLWIWVVIRQLEAADGHFGYDLPWNPLKFLPLYDGTGYHDFHHGYFKGNYAGALGYLDKVFNTRSEGYARYASSRIPR